MNHNLTRSDLDLLSAIRADDGEAFRLLYERYWKVLYIRACKSVDEDEAKDMVQEVMISLWNRRHHIKILNNKDLGPYLFTALKYRTISFYTYTSAQIKKAALLEIPLQASPESLMESKEMKMQLDLVVEAMPCKMQLIFRMSREEGISISDIAFKLKLSKQTVKNQLSQALKRLRVTVREQQTCHWVVIIICLLYISGL